MAQLNPYIHFNGHCRKAMEFYKTCLGGELALQTVGASPMGTKSPDSMQDQIIHASLSIGALTIMATDMNGTAGYLQGNNISLCLNCSSEEQINEYFNRLSEGGTVIHPIHESFWGGLFGVFTDKFGIEWMLNCAIEPV